VIRINKDGDSSKEHKSIKIRYRFFKSRWGIFIILVGVIVSYADYGNEYCIRIADGLWLMLPKDGFSKYGKSYIPFALANISEAVVSASPYKSDTLIIFETIGHNYFDFQEEGFVPATYQWVSEALKIETPDVKGCYNKQLERYEFDFSIRNK